MALTELCRKDGLGSPTFYKWKASTVGWTSPKPTAEGDGGRERPTQHERLSRFPFTTISRNGPEALPGGVVAFKFRGPDGHPLELIQFPWPDPRTVEESTIPP